MFKSFLLVLCLWVGVSFGTFELECDYKQGIFGYACIVNDVNRNIPLDIHLNAFHAANHGDSDVHHFSFGFNLVPKIPNVIFRKFPNLSKLVMIGRHLEEITQEDFVNATELAFFHAGGNFIKKLEANTFVESSKLSTLIFDFNKIEFVSEKAFANLTQLAHLYMTHNSLHHLDRDTFKSLPNLEMVFLNENQLKFIPQGLFRKNRKLMTVNLSDNKLIAVTYKTFYNLRFLNDLDLRNNTCVSEHFRNASQKIGSLETSLVSCDSPDYSEDFQNDFVELELEVVEEKILNLTKKFERLSETLETGFKDLSIFVKTWLENSTRAIEEKSLNEESTKPVNTSFLNLVEEQENIDKVFQTIIF